MDLFGHTQRIESLIKKASAKLAEGDFESSWRLYEQVLLFDEENVAANTFGAICLLNVGRVDEAEPLARAAVRLAPSLPLSHLYLALVLLAKKQSEEAEFELWEAIAVAPDNPEIRRALGGLFFAWGRDQEAQEQLKRCIEIAPAVAETRFLLGLSLLRSGRVDEARELLDTAVRIDPDNDDALTVNALLSIRFADDLLTTPPKIAGFQRAADLLTQALALNPSNDLAGSSLRLVEATLERITKPTEPAVPIEKWYKTALKQLSVWFGLAAVSIAMFAMILWLDESGFANVWETLLGIVIFEVLAFCLMIYLRRDFSALPPSVVALVERVRRRHLRPVDATANSKRRVLR